MGGHVALSGAPLGGRFREDQAELAGGEFFKLLTAIAGFHNGMTAAAVELTAVFPHEEALNTFLYRCTNHGNHVLSLLKIAKRPI